MGMNKNASNNQNNSNVVVQKPATEQVVVEQTQVESINIPEVPAVDYKAGLKNEAAMSLLPTAINSMNTVLTSVKTDGEDVKTYLIITLKSYQGFDVKPGEFIGLVDGEGKPYTGYVFDKNIGKITDVIIYREGVKRKTETFKEDLMILNMLLPRLTFSGY